MRILITFLLSINLAIAGQLECTAKLIYHELRNGTDEAKRKIVIEPTFNRAADLLVGGFVASGSKVNTKKLDICKILNEKGQYQWTQWNLPILEKEAFEKSKKLAKEILSKKQYTVTSRRFFNAERLGKLHKTKTKALTLSGMVAY